MGTLIREHIRSLAHLDITCNLRQFPIQAIIRHRDSLQYLRFRDRIGFEEDDDVLCPTLPVCDLSAIASALTHLRTLELDMDTDHCDPAEFLHTIGEFGNLRELTIHTQAVASSASCSSHSPWFSYTADKEIDEVTSNAAAHDSAMCMALGLLKQLTRRQAKNSIAAGQHDTTPLLRKVTVNIGGWKPVLLRRVASSWRRRNRRGIFAERCLVLERAPFQSSFSMTELVASEPRLSNSPPRQISLKRRLGFPMISVW